MFGQLCDAAYVESVAYWVSFLLVVMFGLGWFGRRSCELTEDEIIDRYLSRYDRPASSWIKECQDDNR